VVAGYFVSELSSCAYWGSNPVPKLKKGERIPIAGFGILQVKHLAARMGRNPATGGWIKIEASTKV
jgi:hypothetical protein